MSYDYQRERPKLFTENGIQMVIDVRDRSKELLKIAGAFTCGKVIAGCTGDSWLMLAAVDYLVERGEIRQILNTGAMGQEQVYVK
jgi:hypothetical protein